MSDIGHPREDVTASEMYDEETMEPVAVVISWKEKGKYYWATLPAKDCDLRMPNLDSAERHEIPFAEGNWKKGMLEAPRQFSAHKVYVKKPQVSGYAVDAVAAELAQEHSGRRTPDLARSKSRIGAALQRDADMYEILRPFPHRNIAVSAKQTTTFRDFA